MPTVNGDAPRDSASSDTVIRLPVSTTWLAMASGTSTASVREDRVQRASTGCRSPLCQRVSRRRPPSRDADARRMSVGLAHRFDPVGAPHRGAPLATLGGPCFQAPTASHGASRSITQSGASVFRR